ncbi:hypothetical protein KKE06_00635 [Candidatus Micrarchaeota archaeon]|nr:hypothetical protein [Candidatus Micrarchaeota archaeon]MBU1930309.1 hypothetical protein [Candidatus Micrarchaeota archaeon]
MARQKARLRTTQIRNAKGQGFLFPDIQRAIAEAKRQKKVKPLSIPKRPRKQKDVPDQKRFHFPRKSKETPEQKQVRLGKRKQLEAERAFADYKKLYEPIPLEELSATLMDREARLGGLGREKRFENKRLELRIQISVLQKLIQQKRRGF